MGFVATGLRQANVSQLEWTQVNLALCHAVIPPEKYKNGKAHAVPMNEAAIDVVTRQIGTPLTFLPSGESQSPKCQPRHGGGP